MKIILILIAIFSTSLFFHWLSGCPFERGVWVATYYGGVLVTMMITFIIWLGLLPLGEAIT